jgi:hypothetical protein
MRPDVNLDLDERAARLRMALIALGLCIVGMIVLSELAVGAPYWLGLGLPLFIVSTLVVQAYTGVCPTHAKKGTRALDGGTVEPVLDPARVCTLQARGKTGMVSALIIAASTTAIVVALVAIR